MKKRVLSFILLLTLIPGLSLMATVISGSKVTVTSYANQQIEINGNTELHLTATTNVLTNSKITLNANEAWVFFDNVRPSVVAANYLSQIRVGGDTAKLGVNVRVEIYLQGAVVIPHAPNFKALTVYKGTGFSGDSAQYPIAMYNTGLGTMDNAIQSIKLKRGYMATFACNTIGTGYSRVYIADKADVIISQLPDALKGKISFIRVFPWKWVSKKGWAGAEVFADTLNCTWRYDWGAGGTSTLDMEFVPMRHNSTWDSYSKITAKQNTTQALAFNEPERADQANMTVEQCIAQWPELLKSGLRLGSPAVAGNDEAKCMKYLESFFDKCDSLNYRVDFIAIHSYYGGLTAKQMYDLHKKIFTRFGNRPIWLTEWNNGANWTTETWPSTLDAQFTKQKTDMTNFFNMLDTATIFERHAVFNNVAEKRYMTYLSEDTVAPTHPKGFLTPAGVMMRNFNAKIAYTGKYDVVRKWNPFPINLSTVANSTNTSAFKPAWVDPNGEMMGVTYVQKQDSKGVFQDIASFEKVASNYEDPSSYNTPGTYTYRVIRKSEDGLTTVTSNEAIIDAADGSADVQYGKSTRENSLWSTIKFAKTFSARPAIILGTPTYGNPSLPLTSRIKTVYTTGCSNHIEPWKYNAASTFTAAEKVAYLASKTGTSDWGGLTAQSGVVSNVNTSWVTVTFPTAFAVIPAVFVAQTTSYSSIPTTVRIRNVSKTGFQVCLQKELAQKATALTSEEVNYTAVTPGTGTINNCPVTVGISTPYAVSSTSFPVILSTAYSNPLVFANIQTSNDTIPVTLRYASQSATSILFVKQRETSTGTSVPNNDGIAWMIMDYKPMPSAITRTQAETTLSVYPNPVTQTLYIKGLSSEVRAEVYTLSGTKVMDEITTGFLDFGSLTKGVYMLKINNQTIKVVK